MFNPGDQIRRINSSWGGVILGEVYTVDRTMEDHVFLKGYSRPYDAGNFELVSAAAEAVTQAAAPRGGKPHLLLVQEFVEKTDAKELADRAWAATKAMCKGE